MILWIIKTVSDVSGTSTSSKNVSRPWLRRIGGKELSPPLDCRRSFGGSPAAPAGGGSTAERGIVVPELSCRRVPPAGAAHPLVNKILAMLWLEGSGEVGSNIQLCPLPTKEGAPKLTRLFGNCMRSTFINAYSTQNHVQIFFKVCMRVGAPETQNTPNPRKSVVFIICPL